MSKNFQSIWKNENDTWNPKILEKSQDFVHSLILGGWQPRINCTLLFSGYILICGSQWFHFGFERTQWNGWPSNLSEKASSFIQQQLIAIVRVVDCCQSVRQLCKFSDDSAKALGRSRPWCKFVYSTQRNESSSRFNNELQFLVFTWNNLSFASPY
jgi:hypothetical protein